MKRKVVIAKTAERRLEDIFDYLVKKWSKKVKDEFIQKLDKNIEIISIQPEIFPESNKRKGLRRCVVTKHVTIFYKFNLKRIDVVTVFDTRQNSKKLKKEI